MAGLTNDTTMGYPIVVFRYQQRDLSNGDVGTKETLRVMAQLARADASHPLVRDVAVSCIQQADPSTPYSLCEAIRRWCASAVTFRHDPPELELVTSPEAQLRMYLENGTIIGDCDDAATLAAGIALAAGCRVRLVAVAFLDKRANYRHVWCEIAPRTGTQGDWIECDVTRSFQNIPVESISRVLVYPVT